MKAGLLFTVALTPLTLVGNSPCAKEVAVLQSRILGARFTPLISTQVFWEMVVLASLVALATRLETGALSVKVREAASFGPKTDARGRGCTWENPATAPANINTAVKVMDFINPS